MPEEKGNKPTRHFTEGGNGAKPFRIVLIAGFETFNRCADDSYNLARMPFIAPSPACTGTQSECAQVAHISF